MIDLKTDYLGLKLKNPLVVSSSPLTGSLDGIKRLEDAGAAAIVLPSIFEEQLTLESNALDSDLSRGTDSFSESTSFLPDYGNLSQGQDTYLNLLRQAKASAGIPILASLNGASAGGWIKFAKELEDAGADALELNTYSIATNAHMSGESLEEALIDLVAQVKKATKIPVAVKLSAQYTSVPHLARHLDDVGADALVIFNRFYQPDFDIENLSVVPRLNLSRPEELLLRLHWTAILYSHLRAQIAITGGVHSAEDVLKSLMSGAQVVMMASVLLEEGIPQLSVILKDLDTWMDEHDYTSIQQMRGSLSRCSVPDSSAFERGNYIKTLSHYTLRAPTTPAA
ncbi:MAG: dihydroorotate dehydrogenase-like protein [Acidobacteriaceae bacterium]|nr:dihydroorotate dehydrogenase-like protein [Acidobacteriaceae bacterium]